MTISVFHSANGQIGYWLGLTTAVKESAFLLWILAAVLSENGCCSNSLCWIRWATAAGNA